MKPPLEKVTQSAICDYLALKKYFFWRQNTAPIFDKGFYRPMPKYSLKGVADIIVVHKGTVIFIEVKRKGAKLSEAQEEFQQRCYDAGVLYVVADSLDDVVAFGL
jgi:hypothetical protein